ncbi:rhomboid family intramembrane serine protease [Cohaesibacter celericrescens]|uniref:Rhomboid family intramembrane serine protease n=1 Tax=Cohaesibacter celericrescens TaxID=2067669 RepID=A0A2N5XUE2_9HYPH|nr:rhomboid family intramembrane serine protease [Cohaesibacter celericrescens]PLW78065.1 rhomboid family intramembrane serine protease [Cohaesibacter celericrescens]
MFIPLHDKNKLVHVRWQYVTISLIVLNVIIFLITESGAGGLVLQDYAIAFGLIPDQYSNAGAIAISDPILLTAPISYAFLHADWMHLIGNMAFLWVFGDNIEDAMGHFRYLLFYCLCAMGAALVHMLANWGSPVPLVGASGAMAGIIAAYLLLHPDVRVWVLFLGRIPLPIPAMYCLGAWILLQIFNSVTSDGDTVAWWAHVGGALTGALLIPFMKRRSVPLFQRGG